MVTTFSLEYAPRLPPPLTRLADLADNLMYSWDYRIRSLFWRIDPLLWRECGNNPRLFLRRVPQARLDEAAADSDYLYEYQAALAALDRYVATEADVSTAGLLDPAQDLVAYFCAEYGVHDSLPIYSGGLGVLAADHCKAASDLAVPLVAVGIYYREGYFTQRIDATGQQQANYLPIEASELPMHEACNAQGPLRIRVPVGSEQLALRLWIAQVGRVRLLLLDADIDENPPALRAITRQLYGGDQDTRIRQEIVLGIGGARALQALGLVPTVWHINEGHASFLVLERIRHQMERGLDCASAVECVAAATVFTTHTAVSAGHDRFTLEMMHEVLGPYLAGFGVPTEVLLRLGAHPDPRLFSMTALGIRGARWINGVSSIHRGIAAAMESYLWPQIAPEENPITAITNGIHLQSFMSRLWMQELHDEFPGWTRRLLDVDYWKLVEDIPYHRFVAVRQRLKCELLADLDRRLQRQHERSGTPAPLLEEMRRRLAEGGTDTLMLGSARRFATYKRANLLLRDRPRLAALLNDPARPVRLVVSGKAHPRDAGGQALIRELYTASLEPDLIGRLVVVEGYDLTLAGKLVQGCDVWLNTPEYPMEACGTSGMKAAINGAVNLSVLDGWWPEAWDGCNGFAIHPDQSGSDANSRDDAEGRQLLHILERQVLPLYFGADGRAWSEPWIAMCRRSMRTVIPRFNAQRMLFDYLRRCYAPAARRGRRLAAEGGAAARELARWKQQVSTAWPQLGMELLDEPPRQLAQDQRVRLRLRLRLAGLRAEDVTVECLVGRNGAEHFEAVLCARLDPGPVRDGQTVYALDLQPLSGMQHYRIRAYPRHPLLSHPFETGCMRWI